MRELVETECRRIAPVWTVNRLYLKPDGSFFSKPIGKWRAWTRDQAISKAAHAVKCLAVLTASKTKA